MFVNIFREVTRCLVKRAEKAGYKALVLTVDTPFFGLRNADIRNKFKLPPHLRYSTKTLRHKFLIYQTVG